MLMAFPALQWNLVGIAVCCHCRAYRVHKGDTAASSHLLLKLWVAPQQSQVYVRTAKWSGAVTAEALAWAERCVCKCSSMWIQMSSVLFWMQKIGSDSSTSSKNPWRTSFDSLSTWREIEKLKIQFLDHGKSLRTTTANANPLHPWLLRLRQIVTWTPSSRSPWWNARSNRLHLPMIPGMVW